MRDEVFLHPTYVKLYLPMVYSMLTYYTDNNININKLHKFFIKLTKYLYKGSASWKNW